MDAEDTVGIMGVGLLLTASGYIAILLPWIFRALLPQAQANSDDMPVDPSSDLICSVGCILITSGIFLFFVGLVLHLSIPESLIDEPGNWASSSYTFSSMKVQRDDNPRWLDFKFYN